MFSQSIGIIENTGNNNVTNRKVSTFKNSLRYVPVHQSLMEGVHVLRVKVNGIMRESFLTLSQDKFTLYVTSGKIVSVAPKSYVSFGWLRFLVGSPSIPDPAILASSASSITNHTLDVTNPEERSIDIGAIDRIQRGQTTQKFELAKKSRQDSRRNLMMDEDDDLLYPNRSFSIIFRGGRTLDLMMRDESDDRDEVLDALDNVIKAYKAAKVRVEKDVLLLRYIWLDVDKEKRNALNVNEIHKVLERINFHVTKPDLDKQYQRFGKIIGLDRMQRRKGLTFEQCCTFLHKIKRDSWMVKPVNIIWNDLFGEIMNNGKQRMTVSDKTFLEKFVYAKQGETNVTVENVRDLFKRLHEMEITKQQPAKQDVTRIDKNQFETYLKSQENDAFDRRRERFDGRLMNRSISEYWINSSHNTYLTGDQLTSHSSVEMYMNALYRGCRCLELDIWDGDHDGSRPIPVVWHGHTMTSKIKFRDIIQCLKVFLNFHPETYPLILSFENHCSIPFQKIMAKDLINILGDLLYVPSEVSLFSKLPSPEDLRGLVVIKGRRPDLLSADGFFMDSVVEFESDEESDDDESDLISNNGTEKTSISVASAMSGATKSQKKIMKKLSPELARLTLFHSCGFKNWDLSIQNGTHYMHSFSESKVKKMCRQSKSRKWAIYNQTHMSRTYPAGSRTGSSNYNPMLAWSTGCQLVALNFQTPDAPLKINDGRFRENGNCGYVLKPSALMMMHDFSRTKIPTKLSVRILSGSCLPKPRGQRTGDCTYPYVKVSVYDVKNEEKDTCEVHNTPVSQNNGYFPIWHNAMDSRRFSFIIENVAVAMLHLEVYTKGDIGGKDEFISHSAIPISCLRQGYRSVQLFDSNNTRSGPFDFASLLIETKLRQVVTEI